MFTTAAPLALNEVQRKELEALVRSGNSSQKVALRSRVQMPAGNRYHVPVFPVSESGVLALITSVISCLSGISPSKPPRLSVSGIGKSRQCHLLVRKLKYLDVG
jgi:hypothetical protein